MLLDSAFGLQNITYMMCYCIYTGASAILEDAKRNRGNANATLQTYLRALNSGMRRCPLLERSLQIIVKGLNSTPGPISATSGSLGQTEGPSLGSISYIPAFPYIDQPVDFDGDGRLYGFDMDSMAMLDSYPEMQMDLGDHILC